MLSEMPRQILNSFAQLPVFPDARVIQVEAHLLKMIFEVIRRTPPFATVHHARQPVERVLVEPERFADFPRRGAVAIGDDVRGHRGAELAVALLYLLNRLLSLPST